MTDSGSQGLAGLPSPTLSRRDLLLLGGAGAASLLLTGVAKVSPALDLAPLESLLGAARRPLSIGFWERGSGDTRAGVVDAGRMPAASDGAHFLSDGARVSILGLYPRDGAALSHLESVAIDVLYTPFHDQAFRAWEFTNGATVRASSPVAVTVPVDRDVGMSVRLTYRLAGAAAATSHTATFTLGSDARAYPLRDGVYLIALPDATNTVAEWSRYQVSQVDAKGRMPLVVHRHAWGQGQLQTASQPYIVLSVK